MQMPRKSSPNIPFVIVDDYTSWDVTVVPEIKTPAIDRLQEMVFYLKMRFVRSLFAVLRKLYDWLIPDCRKRRVRHYSRADEDAPNVADIPKWFKRNGYTTISNGVSTITRKTMPILGTRSIGPMDFRVYLLPENQGLGFKEQVAWQMSG